MTSLPQQIHLIGIGGSGMSAIARVLLGRGKTVSGSDMRESEVTRSLQALGARIAIGHTASNLGQAEMVVRSSAVPDHNPEVEVALQKEIPVLKRSGFLGALMAEQKGIAVAGTHGKTTTTGMIAHILLENDKDPSIIVGADLPSTGFNGRAGHGAHFVIEADEYDRMFLGLRPQIAILTNVEHDHPDIFPTRDTYFDAYRSFAALVPESGTLIACTEDRGVNDVIRGLPADQQIRYGFSAEGGKTDLIAVDIEPNSLGGTSYTLHVNRAPSGRVDLAVPGNHNILNSLAAIAATVFSDEHGVNLESAVSALTRFTGMGRRFDVKGRADGVTVIDDYAHHPTEIIATLQACRSRYPTQTIWAVWEPHTFSRTQLFMDRFKTSFNDADHAIVLDIYKSRETDTLGLTGASVASQLDHPAAKHGGSIAEAAEWMTDALRPGDIVIIMNAGDATQLSGLLLNNLGNRVTKLEGETI